MKAFLSVLALTTVLVGSAFAFNGHDKKTERTVTVSGEGSAAAVPDVAYLRLGVVTEGETVGKASKPNKVAMDLVFKVLKNAKVDDKDVCTYDFGIQPKYKYVQNDEPKLVGYTVHNDVVVTVRDLDKTGTLLDCLTVDGLANRVHSVTFDVLDKEKAVEAARANAVKNAYKKAKLLTETAGAKVGAVVTISESQVHHPRMNYESGSMRSMVDSESRTPIAKGERQIKVNVNVVYEITN